MGLLAYVACWENALERNLEGGGGEEEARGELSKV